MLPPRLPNLLWDVVETSRKPLFKGLFNGCTAAAQRAHELAGIDRLAVNQSCEGCLSPSETFSVSQLTERITTSTT